MRFLYPQLQNARVRGCLGAYYLQRLDNGVEFSLQDDEAGVLLLCTGANSYGDLLDNQLLSEAKLKSIIEVLSNNSLLTLNNKKTGDLLRWPDSEYPYLKDIQFEITGKCNLSCAHCYGHEHFFDTSQSEMATDEIISIIEQASMMNVSRCFFTGGEAFLRKDLPLLIKACYENQIYVSGIFTNGTIQREDVFCALEECNFKSVFLVSIDAPDELSNSEIRGSGIYDTSIEFIKQCVSRGYKVIVNTVVMRSTVNRLFEMREIFSGLGVFRWRIAVPREQGSAATNAASIIPDWEDVFDAYEALLKSEISKRSKMNIQLSSIFKSEFLDTKKYYLFQPFTACCQYKRNSVVVSSDGTVIACPASYKLQLGNLRDEPLSEVWNRQPLQDLKAMQVENTDCMDCELLPYCGGGCRMMAWELTGSYTKKDPSACPVFKFFYERILPIYSELGIEGELLAEDGIHTEQDWILD